MTGILRKIAEIIPDVTTNSSGYTGDNNDSSIHSIRPTLRFGPCARCSASTVAVARLKVAC